MQAKKQLTLLLLLAAVLCTAVGFQVAAAEQSPEIFSDDMAEADQEDFVIEDGILKKYQGMEEEVIVPDGVTEIGYSAFFDNKTVRSVILPEGVTKIGGDAFMYCMKLETVQFPSTLCEIRNYAFTYCGSLKEAIIPNGVNVIRYATFRGCGSLELLQLPDTLERIEDSAFSSCEKLQKVIIPEGVTDIGYEAFWNCSSLSEIQIPSTATNPGGGTTYALTPWLERQLAAQTKKSPFLIINDVLVASRKDVETAVTIPDGVVKIADYGLSGTAFTSITIADSVVEIGDVAFQACSKLEKIYMPDSVKNLGCDAFYECKSLKEVRFSDSLKVLTEPFYKCYQLEEVEFPTALEELRGFIFVRCKKLKKVVVYSKLKRKYAERLPNGTDITEKNVHKKIVIYVDKGSSAEKYLRSLKGKEKIAYAYNEKSSTDSAKYKTYTVKKGDSLWNIAKKYLGAGNRYTEIVTLNKLGNQKIKVGLKLKLPKK